MPKFILSVLFLSISFNIHAQTKTFESRVEQSLLIELYTSEGCSSCPPAEAWFSKLKKHPQLWSAIIPLAFHVDYWDYIGWKDRFASNRYSQRQQQYRENGMSRNVYTPGFFVDGKEWKGFFGRREIELGNRKSVGRLKVNLQDRAIEASFSPIAGHNHQAFRFNLALLGFDLFSRVDNGENKGRILHHDFVVLDLKELTMKSSESRYTVTTTLGMPGHDETKEFGFAAWVTKVDSPVPIQSVGGFLD